MTDLHNGLAEVHSIRQLARDAPFRAYGPATLAATGALALLAAAAQAHWLKNPGARDRALPGVWIATAVVSLTFIGIENVTRMRRVHSGLTMETILSTVAQFLPAIVSDLLLTMVLLCRAESLDASGLVTGAV